LVTAADAAGPLHEEVSTGEVLQSASAEETAHTSEKLIRIVKDKTRMSAEELEHRGDVHNDVLRKMLDAFLQKFLVPTPPGGDRGLGSASGQRHGEAPTVWLILPDGFPVCDE